MKRTIKFQVYGEYPLFLKDGSTYKKSTFGDYNKKQDVLDLEYRSSKEMLGENIYFQTENEELCKDPPQEFKNTLKKLLKRNIKLNIYKLNHYEVGDFFKYHQDTPKSTEFLGTLLWGLSNDYLGGELEVNNTERFTIFKNDCVFLYGDIPHQVLPVQSGNRDVLAFDVFTTEEEDDEEEDEEEEEEETEEETAWKEIVSSYKKNDSQNYVTIPLEFSYVRSCPGGEIAVEERHLKGFDRYIYNKFKDCEYHEISEYVEKLNIRYNSDSDDSGWDENEAGSNCLGYDNDNSVYYGSSIVLVNPRATLNYNSEDHCDHKTGYTGNSYCAAFEYSGMVVLSVRKVDFLRIIKG
jgi:hypothetical protein